MVGDTFSAHMPALLPWTPPEGTSTEKHHSTAQTPLKCLEVPRAPQSPSCSTHLLLPLSNTSSTSAACSSRLSCDLWELTQDTG